MPRFNYTAIDSKGKAVKGTITAESAYSARKHIRARNIHPTTVTEASSDGESRLLSIFGKGGKRQIIDFTKQMATLLNSDIKLTEALSVMVQQASDVKFRNAITDIRDRVVTGESFTDALGEYSDYFDVIYVSMVRVGEVTGLLGKSLQTIADLSCYIL